MKDFKNINFELIDINVNSTPDLYINRATITFSKKVLEDMNYPANVQYCISPENRVFAIRACKSKYAFVGWSDETGKSYLCNCYEQENSCSFLSFLTCQTYVMRKVYELSKVVYIITV